MENTFALQDWLRSVWFASQTSWARTEFNTKDCQLALCKTGLNNVTLDMISNLLSGIAFHPSHPSTLFFTTHFSKGDAYLEEKHFDCFHELLYSDGYFYPSGISKPIILPPSFFTYLHSDTTDTINWLKQKFISEGLWFDGHFFLKPC